MRRPFAQLFCHLVWATWDRQPLIAAPTESRLYGAIQAKLWDLKCAPVAMGGVEDHVHCLCRFSANVSIAYLVQQVKGSSSHLMTHEVGIADFKWQGSDGAFTVSREAVPAVRTYVLGQKRHHASGELWTEWEETWLPDGWEEEI